jgi:hypothetical protein
MPCTSTLKENQTVVQRIAEVEKALKRLEQYLTTGTVQIGIGPTGAITFKNWKDRDGLSDVCAYRSLSVSNSWALRQAQLKAETMSGRKVNTRAVAAGIHSHDNGRSWGRD